MKYFDLSTNVIEAVVKEIKAAKKYVRIAIFQLHNPIIFATLKEKLEKGVKVEIITLPYDSINEDIRDRVTKDFEELKSKGAKINFCKWNIGDPSNTKTAVARWYLFHGKFMVTDHAAIALSANFTDKHELDAMLVLDDIKSIKEYNSKFDRLQEYFIKPANKYEGAIRTIIENNANKRLIKEIFTLPENVAQQHKNNWIRDYPEAICPKGYTDKDGLFITPFDYQGRTFIEKAIERAKKYVYIVTESFTDPSFPNFLIKMAQRGVKVYVLSGIKSRDFTDRVQNNIREMLATGIIIKAFDGDVHAKLILTDSTLLLSSINLNMINLGFSRKKGLWRENTETIYQCSNKKIITEAKIKFEHIFELNSIAVEDKLVEKLEKEVAEKLNLIFSVKIEKAVKHLLAIAILNKEIRVKNFVLEIGKAMQQLVTIFNKDKADKEIFYMSLILYSLSERKRDYNELKSIVNSEVDLEELLTKLLGKKLILTEGSFYKRSLV
ncbi:MAG: cardiolipin synthase A [Candidatus Micrarchaeota archaeon]|nr:MAG: cardiolipin synthase A [Candidatus Micrarchaeota archaeon]